jgi:hypothetical protein
MWGQTLAALPGLGKCRSCGRDYEPNDLSHTFHPACGSPVDIPDEIKDQYATQERLLAAWKDISEVIQLLQRDGLLA